MAAEPSGPSCSSAVAVSSGISPPSVSRTGAPTGAAVSDAAAIPPAQSPASTSETASGPATPPAEGKTASAAAAASAIGSAPETRVVFLVANAGNPSSSVRSGTGTSRITTSGAGACAVFVCFDEPSSSLSAM